MIFRVPGFLKVGPDVRRATAIFSGRITLARRGAATFGLLVAACATSQPEPTKPLSRSV